MTSVIKHPSPDAPPPAENLPVLASSNQVAVTPKGLTGLRKAAVFFITIGEEASANIIRELSDLEIQTIGRAVATADPVTAEESIAVLREFSELALARQFVVNGGEDYAARMLRTAFGADGGRRILDRVVQSIGMEAANFDSLQRAEPEQLANFVHSEHPQTIALILSHLPPSQAAALLTAMPAEVRADLARRMADLEQISPEIIAKIASVIGDRLKSLGEISRQSYGGVRAVAEVINHLDLGLQKQLLSEIETDSQELVNSIRDLMFVFEDLLTVDGAGIRELINAADRQTLALALKGSSEKLLNHFLRNMSMAGAEMFREDLESLGPVRIRDVEAAQDKVIAVLRDLESKGILTLSNNAQDGYVV
jgi:flagellar motor switch protein FliG